MVIYAEADVNHPAEGTLRHSSVISNSLPVHSTQRTSSSTQSIHSVPLSYSTVEEGQGDRRYGSPDQSGRGDGLPDQPGRPDEPLDPPSPSLVNQFYESLPKSSVFVDGVSKQAQAYAFKKTGEKVRRNADFDGSSGRQNQITENRKSTCMLYLQVNRSLND